MDSSIQLYSYGEEPVRVIMLGDPPAAWFVAKDVCDILELSNVTEALRPLDDDELSSVSLKSGGQDREMRLVNESGLYGLVFRSNKPEAKQFSKWVRSTVLPQLNNTGTFSIGQPPAPQSLTEDLRAVQIVLEPAGIIGNQLSLALDKVYYAHTGRSALETAGIQLVAPTKEQLLTPTDIGHHFGVSPQKINQLLCDNGLQHKAGGNYEPTDYGSQYAVMLDINKWHKKGIPMRQLKWTTGILDELTPYFN